MLSLLSYIEVFQRRRGQDVDDLHHVLVVEVPQQPDLPHDALGVHQVVESSGNLLDRHLQSPFPHNPVQVWCATREQNTIVETTHGAIYLSAYRTYKVVHG